VKYLSKATARGTAYRVDLRLRPYGKDGPIVLSKAATLAYYDRAGVTWERQALIKARPIAGDSVLGAETLEALVPFIYRRYLSFVEINEIKSMKRKIERRANDPNGKSLDLKVGFGGIRDTEFVVQFLQLLHGFRYADLREANTLVALRRLARHGCVNQDEYAAMETAYRFLRKVEHRLQFLFDRQTHSLPDDPIELDRLGRRLGYPHDAASTSGERFASDLQIVTARNRSTLNRLLHGPFDADGGAGESTPETDLALDDEPNDETVATTLGVYGFKSVDGAYRNLRRLAVEEIPFLSSVRCRHFLAGLAPKLLTAIGATPDPDETLNNLVDVSSSIGAKGVLWESCSVNPEILKLFVKLCSRSRLLTELLIRNPGMIDELLDSLMMSRPPSDAELIDELESLLRGAVDVNPILHSFKSRRLLDIGVADLLGKRSVVETTGRLSGVADAALVNVVERHRRELNEKVGEPLDDAGRRIRFGLFALGKHGGREIGYHSDLDLLFLYEREGTTAGGTSASKISGQEYFVELVRRMTATLSKVGPLGKLYAVDFRLRPTGKSGNLVINIDQFRRYFEDGSGQVWERQALTRCRFIAGDADFGESATAAVREQCVRVPPETSLVDEVANMRTKLNESRSHNDFKRGEGGIVDVEFAVQLTQLRHGGRHPSILNPNIWSAIEAIEAAGLWSAERAKRFADGYRFLRTVECRLGVINGHSNTTWPDDADEVRRLAIRLDYPPENAAPSLMAQIDRTQRAIKSEFEAIVARERRDEIADVKADQPELKAE
jgi:glutamate-ammonia-ligase adenylyltransferase